jgi:hypothetical protein
VTGYAGRPPFARQSEPWFLRWLSFLSAVTLRHMNQLDSEHRVALTVSCLECGHTRTTCRTLTRSLEAPSCPSCGYLGWREGRFAIVLRPERYDRLPALVAA